MNQNEFINEVEKLGIKVSKEQIDKLEKYYEMLIKYNEHMNLTGITDKEEVYLKHFYDSLTIVKSIDLLKETSLCDLGSGAGFPGVVIKIFFPHLKVVLVDSLNKRINFLNDLIQELNLENITAISARIEEYSKLNSETFDVVTARAVAPINILLELGIRLVKVGKYFISLKGNIENEPNFDNAMIKLNCVLEGINKFKLPIENSNRCIIKIKKESSTIDKYPRNYSEIKKHPL